MRTLKLCLNRSGHKGRARGLIVVSSRIVSSLNTQLLDEDQYCVLIRCECPEKGLNLDWEDPWLPAPGRWYLASDKGQGNPGDSRRAAPSAGLSTLTLS